VLVAALNARQCLQLLIALSYGGSVCLEEALITAQDCHDRHRLLRAALEVVSDDIRIPLLEIFPGRSLPGEDAQKSRVLRLD
jgi:hypothetical protein